MIFVVKRCPSEIRSTSTAIASTACSIRSRRVARVGVGAGRRSVPPVHAARDCPHDREPDRDHGAHHEERDRDDDGAFRDLRSGRWKRREHEPADPRGAPLHLRVASSAFACCLHGSLLGFPRACCASCGGWRFLWPVAPRLYACHSSLQRPGSSSRSFHRRWAAVCRTPSPNAQRATVS